MLNMLPLGARAQDIVTGAAGTITARLESLHESPRYKIESLGEDNKVIELWFDQGRLGVLTD